MKRNTLLSLAVSAILLAGCGGGGETPTNHNEGSGDGGGNSGDGGGNSGDGGGNSGDGGGNSGGIDSVNGIDPVSSLTNSRIVRFGQNRSFTVATGFNGDVQLITGSNDNNVYQLTPGIPSINITDIQRTETADISCANGANIRGTENADFSSGRVVLTGTLNGQSLSCISTYQSILDTTIFDNDSIEPLLDSWGSDDNRNNASSSGLISTNCPQDDNDIFDGVDPFENICTGSYLTNYTLTDSDGNIHKISEKSTFH